jgi:hypothetical protein
MNEGFFIAMNNEKTSPLNEACVVEILDPGRNNERDYQFGC